MEKLGQLTSEVRIACAVSSISLAHFWGPSTFSITCSSVPECPQWAAVQRLYRILVAVQVFSLLRLFVNDNADENAMSVLPPSSALAANFG